MKGFSRKAFITFIALGTVSLFADWTYEGSRSILGPYLGFLEASALVVGFASVGDLIGYLMRGAGGLIAHKLRSSRAFWGIVFLGYGINLLAVPALALAGNWEAGLTLIILERAGKGLRTPARDTILAEVTETFGKGKGFGLHELMDQVGAVVGPAFVMWALMSSGGDYRFTFKLLAVPALVALALIFIAFVNHPTVEALKSREGVKGGLSRDFWLYTASMGLLSAGFMHWLLAGYVLQSGGIVAADVGLAYLVAMLSDAAVAFPAGVLYDRLGPKTLIAAPPLAAISGYAILSSGGLTEALIASALWGAVMGLYETNMRVTVADTVSKRFRAYAYGIFGLTFGAAWTAGNAAMGYLYMINSQAILPYLLLVEALSTCFLVYFLKGFRPRVYANVN